MDSKRIDRLESLQGMKQVLHALNDELNDTKSEASDATTYAKKAARVHVETAQGKEYKPKVSKSLIKNFIKEGGAGSKESLSAFAERKALDTGVSAADTIEAQISAELSELAILNQVVLGQFRQGTLPDGSPFTIPKIAQRPNVVRTTENTTGTPFSATNNQTYTHTTADFAKSASMPAFTHEVIQDSVRDVESDCLRLIEEERGFDFIDQMLFGDKENNPATDLRGVLTNRIDSNNAYTEALLEDAVRDPEYLKAIKTGIAGGLPVADIDLVNFLIDVQTDVPFKFQGSSAWYVSNAVFNRLRKAVVNETTSDARPLLMADFGTLQGSEKKTDFTLMGKPVFVVDQLDDVTPIMYGDMNEIEFGMVGGSEHFIVDEVTLKGQKALYADQRFYSVMHNNDSLRIVIAVV